MTYSTPQIILNDRSIKTIQGQPDVCGLSSKCQIYADTCPSLQRPTQYYFATSGAYEADE
jgi:hypothetical protein